MIEIKIQTLTCAALILAFASTCQTAQGFSPLFAQQFSSKLQSYDTHSTSMCMQRNEENSSRNMPQHSLLNREEERELLLRAHEYSRLNELKMEVHLRTPSSTLLNGFQTNENFMLASGYVSEEELTQVMEDGRTARETLITSNMGLVHKVTQQILSSSPRKLQTLTYDDLIQEGSIGLSRSIDKYTFSHNTRFGTYAYYWIRASILRALAEKNEYVRVPEHISATISKISKAMSLGSDPNDDIVNRWAWQEVEEAKRLAKSVGEKLDKVDKAIEVEKRRRRGMVVLMGSKQLDVEREDKTLEFEEDRKEELKKMLQSHLKPKEARALSLRYGLEEADQHFRDYEAEAEMDLFGPKGILSKTVSITQRQSVNAKKLGEKELFQVANQGTTTKRRIPPVRGKWGEAMTFKEIGKQMAISAENGRRLCSVGLEKLRSAVEEGKLDPGLLY